MEFTRRDRNDGPVLRRWGEMRKLIVDFHELARCFGRVVRCDDVRAVESGDGISAIRIFDPYLE